MADLHQRLQGFVATAAGASPKQVKMAPLVGQASARSYWRAKAGEKSYVVMVLPPGPHRSEEAASAAVVTELPFINVQRYLKKSGVRVPHIHTYDETAGLLLLDDLGDVTLEVALEKASATEREKLYTAAIDELARLRAAAEAMPDTSCVAFTRAFDFDLYRWELDHFLLWGLFARVGIEPNPAEASALRQAFHALTSELVALPRGFTHRDYQSRNLMVLPSGDVAVIDFQDALLGPRQYDVVALLRDSYIVLDDALVQRLLARYRKTFAAASGKSLEATEFQRGFDLVTVQRKLKDGARFEFIARVKKNPAFLPHVPASFRYVRDALRKLPEYARLLEVLATHLPELR